MRLMLFLAGFVGKYYSARACYSCACLPDQIALIDEHFDENLPDNSPLGGVPGWHFYAPNYRNQSGVACIT